MPTWNAVPISHTSHLFRLCREREGFPDGSVGRESTCNSPSRRQDLRVQFLVQEDALKKEWQPTPVFLLGEFHGQRSLTGYSSRGHQMSDSTEPLTLSPDKFPRHSVFIKNDSDNSYKFLSL